MKQKYLVKYIFIFLGALFCSSFIFSTKTKVDKTLNLSAEFLSSGYPLDSMTQDTAYLTVDTIKFNSLKELAANMETAYIYIDIWSLSCGPCIREFQYSEHLYNFAKENQNKIQLVFIALNLSTQINSIEKLINHYQVRGRHLIPNGQLFKELFTAFGNGKNMLIPRYLLLNKEGEILHSHLSKPSNWNVLEQELVGGMRVE